MLVECHKYDQWHFRDARGAKQCYTVCLSFVMFVPVRYNASHICSTGLFDWILCYRYKPSVYKLLNLNDASIISIVSDHVRTIRSRLA